ncbi:MAG: TetR family transcriptional regulator [Rhodobacter sp. CACIA14H1]|nr:MAG: TetR family transcriptional regulator [Rhodobacter sp. CACIA14H1]
MSGLREKQKADRTRRILESASRLFRDHGYGAIRIEDIAQAAEVSVGTLYNYFTNKGDLLLAIVSMEVEEVLESGKSVVADPPADIARALARLIGIYYDHSLFYLSKEMWRTAMAISIEAPETPFSARYTALDGMLTAQVCDLIRELQRRGYARPCIEADAIGQVIFNNLNQMFIEFVKQDDMRIADLHSATDRQNAVIAEMLALR